MASIGKIFGKQTIFSVTPDISVAEAAKKMLDKKVGSILVMEHEKLAGIFTERDLLNKVIAAGLDPKTVPISQVMSREVCAINTDETISDCYERMHKTHCRHLPIFEKGKLVGMVTMRDLLEKMMDEIDDENQILKDYIHAR
ncbi:MAG: CBS domain-containing protein [bacterium]|nr:CBS domain-containing protein [bacterium]